MAKLTTKEREALPKSDFGLPGKKAYPMPDKSHAANAKARQIVAAARTEAKVSLDDAAKRLAEIAAERDAIAAYIGDLNKAVAVAAKSLTGPKAPPKTAKS